MSRDTAISAGSFFAAASRCEENNLISAGQTETLRQALSQYLSEQDQRNMALGYERGLKDSEIYLDTLKRWQAFVPDDTSCYRVQSVLDDYKSQLQVE